jgi:hypothetical protein
MNIRGRAFAAGVVLAWLVGGLATPAHAESLNVAASLIPASANTLSESAADETAPPETPEWSLILVKVVGGLTPTDEGALVVRHGGTLVSTIDPLRILVVEVPAPDRDQVIQSLQADPEVERVEISFKRYAAATPSDTLYPDQWALPKIGWDGVFGSPYRPSRTARLAVLDSGVDATHPELAGLVLEGISLLDGSKGQSDPLGHGTWMVGIAAAATDNADGIAGIAFGGVNILPVTVLGPDGGGNDSDIVAGIVWAAEQNPDVILMGFSGPDFSQSLQEAIDYAWDRGAVLIAPTGNDGSDAPTFPAGNGGVIGVSATDADDVLVETSNRGLDVFLSAPGESITATDLNGGYRAVSGTSASAAIVAGVSAYVAAASPGLGNYALVGRLARTAEPTGPTEHTGNGRVRMFDAVTSMALDAIRPSGVAGGGGPYVGPYRAFTFGPTTLPFASVYEVYGQQLVTNGGVPPFSFVVVSGSLPAGLSLSSSGLIGGTPTESGARSFYVSATDTRGASETARLSLFVQPPTITIEPAGIQVERLVGAPITQAFSATGGRPPYTFAGTNLPAWLSLSADGMLQGTPTAVGNCSFSVRVTDAGGFTTSQEYLLQIRVPPLDISPSTLPDGILYRSYSQQLTASGGTPPYSFSVSGQLPQGLSLSTDGLLRGLGSSEGTFRFEVVARDANGTTGIRSYSLVMRIVSIVVSPLEPSLPPAYQGSPYSQSFSAAGGTAPYTFTINGGALPTGLALAGNGILGGIPTSTGQGYRFVVVARDADGVEGSREYNLSCYPAPVTITPTSLPDGIIMQPYLQQLTATGGVAPYVFSVTNGSLPAGLSLSPDGLIRGTPTTAACSDCSFGVTATDSYGSAGSTLYTLRLSPPSITVTPSTLPDGTVYASYSQQLSASGGNGPYAFMIYSGGLPGGLTLSDDGLLSGVIGGIVSGGKDSEFQLSVEVKDKDGFDGHRVYTLAVRAPLITMTTDSELPPGRVYDYYSLQLVASGGAAPYRFSVWSGSCPEGLALSEDGLINGIPTEAGLFTCYVRVSDAFGFGGQEKGFRIGVSPPELDLSPATLPDGREGRLYGPVQLVASGGMPPYSFGPGSSLPVYLTVSESGILSGTLVVSGARTFDILVRDKNGYTARRTYAINIAAAPTITIGPAALPPGRVYEPYSVQVTVTGGGPPYVFADPGLLPQGLSFNANGLLSGIPLQPTPTNGVPFAITVTDSEGYVGLVAYTLDIAPPTLTLSPSTLPPVTVYQPYSQQLTVSGGMPPYRLGILSGGGDNDTGIVRLDPVTGVLSESPSLSRSLVTTPCGWGFVVVVSDANGFQVDQRYDVCVIKPEIVIAPASLPDGRDQRSYGPHQLSASGGMPPYRFSGRSLPPYLTLSPSGVLEGTLHGSGGFPFEVSVADKNGYVTVRTYTINIAGFPTFTISPSTLPNGQVYEPYSVQFAAAGGTPPYTFSQLQPLLAGLSFDANGLLSGTPLQHTWPSASSVLVVVTDSDGYAGSATYDLNIAPPTLSLSPSALPPATAYEAYSQALTVTGGMPPYSYAVVSGGTSVVQLDPVTGVISASTIYAPPDCPVDRFAVRATDANGFSAYREYELCVRSPQMTITPATLSAGLAGLAYYEKLTAQGGMPPYRFFVSGGALPLGVELKTDGSLVGTPQESGTFTVSVTVADQQDYRHTCDYSISANPWVTVRSRPATVKALRGQAIDFEVSVWESRILGRVLTDYAGTVRFASTGSGDVVPPDYMFVAEDRGTKAFQVTFGSIGQHTVAASPLEPYGFGVPVPHDPVLQFAETEFPSAAWQYGWSEGPDGLPQSFGWLGEGEPGIVTRSRAEGDGSLPSISLNRTLQSITVGSVTYRPKELVFVPGEGSQYSRLRLAVPVSGVFSISARFAGADAVLPSSNVSVRVNDSEVFQALVEEFQDGPRYSDTLSLSAGDTLDFLVGAGPDGNNVGDATALEISIRQTAVQPTLVTYSVHVLGQLAISDTAHVFDGFPHPVAVTTDPVGLPVTVTYSGVGSTVYPTTTVPPTNAGSYWVVAVSAEPECSDSATATLVISPAAATVSLSDLARAYSGSAVTPTATTNPPGLPVAWFGAPQTNAGTYAVTATIGDPNYVGSAEGTLIISKATARVSLVDLIQTFTGGPLRPTAVTDPGGLAVTWTNAPQTNVGSYEVTATVESPNYEGWASGTFAVTPPLDTTPDPFGFSPLAGAALDSPVTSERVTVGGTNAPAEISISAPSLYSINDGAFTAAHGTVSNGDGIRIRLTSSASYATTAHATLTIGGVSGTFSVTTKANTPPTANAGMAQTAHAGVLVTLDGSASSDPDGDVPLSYAWSILSMPAGSATALSDSEVVKPTLVPDLPGDYVVELVVTDSMGGVSTTAQVNISTTNTPPVADAGPDQALTRIGSTVSLNGSSWDPDGDPITYEWKLATLPAGSAAFLTQASSAAPSFVADVHGTYVVQLVVSDAWGTSAPATATVSFTNLKPVANAGSSQAAGVGETVTLDASRSSDANGDSLTYSWRLTTSPAASQAVIASPTSSVATFAPDVPGLYVAQLIVNDGFVSSDPSTVQVQAISSQAEATETARELERIVASLSPNQFKNPNMAKALNNKLNAVIANISVGEYRDALDQLGNDILGKTDGCANGGARDKNDWIVSCQGQGQVYPKVLQLIQLVQRME